MDANPSTADGVTRRRALAGATALIGGLAGCTSLPGTGPEDPNHDDGYERLHRVAVHVADGVDLSVPDEVETVDARTNADLLVLPDDAAVEAATAVEWLADDRVLALLGAEAEATWLEWARSDDYADAFDNEGYADAQPDPQLLVAGTVGDQARTYRRTWSDGPRDRDVLRALDEVLVDLRNETPR